MMAIIARRPFAVVVVVVVVVVVPPSAVGGAAHPSTEHATKHVGPKCGGPGGAWQSQCCAHDSTIGSAAFANIRAKHSMHL